MMHARYSGQARPFSPKNRRGQKKPGKGGSGRRSTQSQTASSSSTSRDIGQQARDARRRNRAKQAGEKRSAIMTRNRMAAKIKKKKKSCMKKIRDALRDNDAKQRDAIKKRAKQRDANKQKQGIEPPNNASSKLNLKPLAWFFDANDEPCDDEIVNRALCKSLDEVLRDFALRKTCGRNHCDIDADRRLEFTRGMFLSSGGDFVDNEFTLKKTKRTMKFELRVSWLLRYMEQRGHIVRLTEKGANVGLRNIWNCVPEVPKPLSIYPFVTGLGTACTVGCGLIAGGPTIVGAAMLGTTVTMAHAGVEYWATKKLSEPLNVPARRAMNGLTDAVESDDDVFVRDASIEAFMCQMSEHLIQSQTLGTFQYVTGLTNLSAYSNERLNDAMGGMKLPVSLEDLLADMGLPLFRPSERMLLHRALHKRRDEMKRRVVEDRNKDEKISIHEWYVTRAVFSQPDDEYDSCSWGDNSRVETWVQFPDSLDSNLWSDHFVTKLAEESYECRGRLCTPQNIKNMFTIIAEEFESFGLTNPTREMRAFATDDELCKNLAKQKRTYLESEDEDSDMDMASNEDSGGSSSSSSPPPPPPIDNPEDEVQRADRHQNRQSPMLEVQETPMSSSSSSSSASSYRFC